MMCFLSRFAGRVWLALAVTLLAACGGGGGGADPATPLNTVGLTSLPSAPAVRNLLAITVDSGPVGSGYNVNRLYATITVCEPASTTRCQTIDHVLVDTGSTGLRLLSSVLTPGFNLTRLTDAQSRPLLNCAQFVDASYAWGSVVSADVWLGGKTAASVPIQIMADPMAGRAASACSAGGTALAGVADLGANGILGLSTFRQDCGSSCASNHRTGNGYYYACTSDATAACTANTGTTVSLGSQLQNPVPLFTVDNNGVLIDLPTAASGGAPGLSGSLFFGIGTQTNNQLDAAGPGLTTNTSGYLTTVFNSSSLTNSFIDTGSNGVYFDTDTLPLCAGLAGFYCPTLPTPLSATLTGANAVSVALSFSIGNAKNMFGSNTVLPNLGGPIGTATMFDWGLPFYYGRRVFMGIESSAGSGAYYAF